MHIPALFRTDVNVQLQDPLRCSWFYPLAIQSQLRFRLLEIAGRPVAKVRTINDRGKLNTCDKRENGFKTEGRRVHNSKMEFLLILNVTTRMDLKTAFVYACQADSANVCGKGFPWTQGHCTTQPAEIGEIEVDFDGKSLVFCSKCTLNYTECDLHFLMKSTALLMAASGLVHARETCVTVVSNLT